MEDLKMKKFTIENAKQKFFTDKQHYQAFRKAWAAAVTSPKSKSTLEPCNEWINSKDSIGTGKARKKGWITAEHTLLFLLLTEKDFMKAFAPIKNKNKLANGATPYQTLRTALHWDLKRYTSWAKDYKESLKKAENNTPCPKTLSNKPQIPLVYWSRRAEDAQLVYKKFLELFAGTVTADMLCKLHEEMDEMQVYSNDNSPWVF